MTDRDNLPVTPWQQCWRHPVLQYLTLLYDSGWGSTPQLRIPLDVRQDAARGIMPRPGPEANYVRRGRKAEMRASA